MKGRFLLGAAVAAAVALTPQSAHAWSSLAGCAAAGGGFQTCASFQVTTELVGSRTQVYIRVQNEGILNNTGGFEGWSTLTRFGVLSPELVDVQFTNIGSLGAPETIFTDGATTSGTPRPYWDTSNNTSMLGGIEWGISTDNPRGGINSCGESLANQSDPGPDQTQNYYLTCGINQWVVFAFNTSNELNVDDFVLAWGVVAAYPDGESYKGTTSVPEPLSILLLGTGLVGVAAVGRRRRLLEEK